MSRRDDDETPRPPRCTGRTANGQRCTRNAEEGSTRCRQHSFVVPGRPTKLTPELKEQIVWTVLEGNYLNVAAQAAGVSYRTLARWLERADDVEAKALEMVDPDADELPDLYELVDPREWVYLDFRHALKSAEAFAETELLRQARAGGFGWQAPMTVLERRQPTRWKRREVHEHEGEVGVRQRAELVEPDEKKRQRVSTILAEAKVAALTATENTTTTQEGKSAKRKRAAKPRAGRGRKGSGGGGRA